MKLVNGKFEINGRELNNKWKNDEHFLSFLEETLIPDLRESGRDSTADDFEDAATMIRFLKSKLETAVKLAVEPQRDVYTTKVQRKSSTDEWVVVVKINGVRDEAKCYYTNDKADAEGTNRAMREEWIKQGKRVD